MREVFDTIEKVAVTDANVLILGENGSGKDAVASVLHRHSLRSEEVFIPVDVGAISETLFESELFGHVKGAFTDAKEHRAGRFEVASGGSLFLDEIGNLSVSLQAKLLHAIERREVIRVGSNKPIPVDVRLICATNIPVYEKVQDGSFRQDLLYRINTVEIRIPPLRERVEDIPTLAQHFLETYSRKYDRPGKTLSKEATRRLLDYAWPGNVRETTTRRRTCRHYVREPDHHAPRLPAHTTTDPVRTGFGFRKLQSRSRRKDRHPKGHPEAHRQHQPGRP